MRKMHKCPYCGAEITENAKFCLYCMSSLNEKKIISVKKKNKWWLIVLAAILLLIILVLAIKFGIKQSFNKMPIDESITKGANSEIVDSNTNESTNSQEKVTETATAITEITVPVTDKSGQAVTDVSGNVVTERVTEIVTIIVPQTTKENGSTTAINNITTQQASTSTTHSNSVSVTSTTTPPTTTTTTTQSQPVNVVNWNYSPATSYDYYKNYNHIETQNAIVITGFSSVSSNGVYVIPNKIDGKTVVGIDFSNKKGYAFNDVASSVKKIYLPPSLNKIQGNAFSNCLSLTDIYVAGDYLYLEPSALPAKAQRVSKLTFHTSDNAWCLYGAKYFDVYCSQYGVNEYSAAWQEWNSSSVY